MKKIFSLPNQTILYTRLFSINKNSSLLVFFLLPQLFVTHLPNAFLNGIMVVLGKICDKNILDHIISKV